jgi:hypothetical protein
VFNYLKSRYAFPNGIALGYFTEGANIVIAAVSDGSPGHLNVGHRVIHNRNTDLDAFLNAGHAVLMLFEQYRSNFIPSGLVRSLRMRLKSDSFHAVIVTERTSAGYRVFDPGWTQGGWQTLSTEVMHKALADSCTVLIGLDSDDGIDRRERDDGVLLVNRHSGRWEFHPDTGLDALTSADLSELRQYHDTFTTIPDAVAPYQFIINVTNRCSLACVYCYAESPAPKALAKDMSPETFHQIWQFAHRLNPDRESNIIVHGGEPTLVFDSLVDEMRKRTRPLWEEYSKPMGAEAQKIIADYRAKVGG